MRIHPVPGLLLVVALSPSLRSDEVPQITAVNRCDLAVTRLRSADFLEFGTYYCSAEERIEVYNVVLPPDTVILSAPTVNLNELKVRRGKALRVLTVFPPEDSTP